MSVPDYMKRLGSGRNSASPEHCRLYGTSRAHCGVQLDDFETNVSVDKISNGQYHFTLRHSNRGPASMPTKKSLSKPLLKGVVQLNSTMKSGQSTGSVHLMLISADLFLHCTNFNA